MVYEGASSRALQTAIDEPRERPSNENGRALVICHSRVTNHQLTLADETSIGSCSSAADVFSSRF